MTDISLHSLERKFNRYLFEYRFGGQEWGIQIDATTADEAKERLRSLAWAQYRGEVGAIIPVPGGGLIVRIMCRLREVYGRLSRMLQ